MLITVTCDKCQKRYKVDAKLGGKTAKCKACGNSISIPVVDTRTADPTDDLMAGLTAAASAEQPAPAHTVSAKVPHVAPRPQAVPPAAIPGIEGGTDVNEATCPLCGRPFEPAARFCSACGYDRNAPPAAPADEVAMAPVRPAPAAPRYEAPESVRRRAATAAKEEDRDDEGYRRNEGYEGGFMAWLDSIGVFLGQAIFGVLILAVIVGSVQNMIVLADRPVHVPAYAYVIAFMIYPLEFLLWLVLVVPAAYLGIWLAGLMLKFRMPEDSGWRVLATQTCSMSYAMVGWFLMVVYLWLIERYTVGGAIDHASSTLPLIFLITLVLVIPTHFVLTWVLLRLRIAEALVAWLFSAIATVVAFAILVGINFVATLVIVRILSR